MIRRFGHHHRVIVVEYLIELPKRRELHIDKPAVPDRFQFLAEVLLLVAQ
jgi:hypothetical protein